MNNNEKLINDQILMELGFEIGQNKRIIDSDTCQPVQMNGKFLIAPGCTGSRITQEFDAYTNPKMMEKLFDYFTQKEGNENISAVYHVYDGKDKTTGSVECTIREGSITKTIKSESYHADSLKYLDLMRKLNGTNDNLNLKDMDYQRDTKAVKQKKNAAAPTAYKKKRG